MDIEMVGLVITLLTAVVLLVIMNYRLEKEKEKGKIEYYKDWIIVSTKWVYYAIKEKREILKSFSINSLKEIIDKIIEEENFKRLYDKFSNGKSEIKGEGITNLYTYPEPKLKKKGGKK